MVTKKVIIIPLLIAIMIVAFSCCCFCGHDECCVDDTKMISSLPVGIFQEEATQDDLLMFWIPLVLGIVFGILLIGSLIAGLLNWMNFGARKSQSLLGMSNEDNWVYGSRVQDKAALSAEKGQNLAPVKETK